MNDPRPPVKAVTPPVTTEVLAEVTRRLDPAVMAGQESAARPGDVVMRELLAKHTPR